MQQAYRVACGRITKARKEFFGNRGAANDRAALEHMHTQTGRCQITRANETIVSAADDSGIDS
jgi:hypothetical protein